MYKFAIENKNTNSKQQKRMQQISKYWKIFYLNKALEK